MTDPNDTFHEIEQSVLAYGNANFLAGERHDAATYAQYSQAMNAAEREQIKLLGLIRKLVYEELPL
jgi:hypothetical protein